MLGERLKLTDGDKTKVSDILTKSEEAMKPLIQAQRKAAEECVTALTKPGLQEIEVQTAADLAMKAEAAILTEKIKTLFALRAALSPEQVTELNSMIDQATSIWRPGAFGPMMNRFPAQPTQTQPTPPAEPKAPESK